MYGEETGAIRVRVKVGKGGRERILWEEKGEKPDKWYRAEIEVNPAFFLNDYGLVTGKQNDEVLEHEEEFDESEDETERATSLSSETDAGLSVSFHFYSYHFVLQFFYRIFF